MNISDATRRTILDYIIASKYLLSGKLDILSFLERIWDLDSMPSTDSRFKTARGDISQHMVNNDDWDLYYLLNTYLRLPKSPNEKFIQFLENCLHPMFQDDENKRVELLSLSNQALLSDELKLLEYSSCLDKSLYKLTKIKPNNKGVSGTFKNLIFAADGLKPKIVITDLVNNDISIIENEGNCLIYDKPIDSSGLLWKDLLDWWNTLEEQTSKSSPTLQIELRDRLHKSLASEPEKLLYNTYYDFFLTKLGESLPALIPQVYLHYDPYTVKQLSGHKQLFRQRMDFLLLLSNYQRIVIEVDGKHHYAEGEKANPKKYAEMVSEDRKLKLLGYEVYRFGGYELQDTTGKDVVTKFFNQLFERNSITKR